MDGIYIFLLPCCCSFNISLSLLQFTLFIPEIIWFVHKVDCIWFHYNICLVLLCPTRGFCIILKCLLHLCNSSLSQNIPGKYLLSAMERIVSPFSQSLISFLIFTQDFLVARIWPRKSWFRFLFPFVQDNLQLIAQYSIWQEISGFPSRHYTT